MNDTHVDKDMSVLLNSRSSRKLHSVARVIVVSKEEGNDHFTTAQDAISAVPANNRHLIIIQVKPVIYK